jgi:ornithine cyclodeaminase/alanine dehydrogenase-like protein (mu-crystallin family)
MALLIRAEEFQGRISVAEAIAAVREGFPDQGDAPAYSAPRLRIHHQDRRLSVHSGGCHRLQVAGCFVHAERYTFHGGAQQYETAGKRVYVAYDSETAALTAIIVGSLPLFDEPEAESFASETPITAAVGTDLLARADCRVLGLYGTGRQARRHLMVMCAIRPGLAEARVYSRSAENRARFVAQMQPRVRAHLIAVESPESAAGGADLICLATGSNVPVLFGAWLSPGQHVTSIVAGGRSASQAGSGSPSRRELDDDVIARADCVVATLKAQAILDDQADLCIPVAKGLTSWDKVADLGEIVAGRRTGRRSSSTTTSKTALASAAAVATVPARSIGYSRIKWRLNRHRTLGTLGDTYGVWNKVFAVRRADRHDGEFGPCG